ncbi:acyltransferase [Gilliamella apicola]|uniref:Acyltransferase n=1 Tax=Gilliamella apicola TaxID=1196095 RepID=A0A2V4DZE0_9GAMM|nr:hypothetical protein [Gilliamella apicola]PXZ06205.1 hypothetical protein DKK79_05965 [Gilliamella apicola]
MLNLFKLFSKKSDSKIYEQEAVAEIPPPIIFGENNTIIYKDNNNEIQINNFNYQDYLIGINLHVIGNNNTIIIDSSASFKNSSIKIDYSNNGTLKIEGNSELNNLEIIADLADNFFISFGRDNKVQGGLSIICIEHNSGFISGNECLYSHGIKAISGDGHTILDHSSGQILNKPEHYITIGDHCWIGERVLLTKNTQISDNSIVAMGSIVTKNFLEENIIIGGNPAKIIKENIDWHSCRISDYIREFQ